MPCSLTSELLGSEDALDMSSSGTYAATRAATRMQVGAYARLRAVSAALLLR